MSKVEQGDIIKIEHASVPFLVVSSDIYNASGQAVVCPIVKAAAPDALHVAVQTPQVAGVVLCEQMTSVSVRERALSGRGCVSGERLLDIIYRVQSIFDYVPHAE